MKLNKYLAELGLEWYDLPGNYDEKLIDDEELESVPAADPRNEEDDEGFCGYEFFNLGYSFDLYIYSRLAYFREHIAPLQTPSCCLSSDLGSDRDKEERDKDHELWISIVDKIVDGFKLAIVGDESDSEIRFKIQEARRLLAEYWDCLWY